MAGMEDLTASISRLSTRTGAGALSGGLKTVSHLLKAAWLGAPLASAIAVLWEVYDYGLENDKVVREYRNEIRAKLGINPEEPLTRKDMIAAAEENPTLAEALKRNRRKRNLLIGTDVACTLGAFGIAVALTPLIVGAAAPIAVAAICGGAVSFASFVIGKVVLDDVGKRLLHLKEPPIERVLYDASLQSDLSLPSQIKYLERLHNMGKEIFPSQVKGLFQSANGASYSDAYIQQVTDDLNQHLIRPQELAFLAYGQKSGVPKLEQPETTPFQQRIMEAQQVIKSRADSIGGAVKDKASAIGHAAHDKAGELKDNIGNYWREKFPEKRGLTPGEIAQQRKTQGSSISPENIAASRDGQADALGV